jgi:hypothetical protein
MSTTITPTMILERFKDKNLPATYIMGCYATRVTFHAQQIRAFNLIYALFQAKKLKAGSKVCIIGGGLGGLTAAAAAHLKGCDVTVYEAKEYLFHHQKGCLSRYVHPHIYDWPEAGSENAETDLPCLNWKADTADEVLRRIKAEWQSDFSTVRTRPKHEVSAITNSSNKPRVAVVEPYVYEPYDCVIVAAGFGLEQTVDQAPLHRYWKSDDLHQPFTSATPPTTVLVSGCGDGGLIDTLRLAVNDFKHDTFTTDFLNDPLLDDLKESLLEIEERAFDDVENASTILWDGYRNLDVPAELIRKLKDNIRTDTKVTLNGKGPTPMTVQSSLINRFAVFLLLDNQLISYREGKLEGVNRPERGYKVNLLKGNGETDILTFDEVIVRHGPEPVAQKLVARHSDVASLSKKDPVALRQWPDGFYPVKTNPIPTPTPMETAKKNLPALIEEIEKHAEINHVGIGTAAGPFYNVSIKADKLPAALEALKTHHGIAVNYKCDASFSFSMGAVQGDSGRRLAGGAGIYNANRRGPDRSGTLGCFVELPNGRIGVLSSYHVLAMNGEKGDPVFITDGDFGPGERIGELYAFAQLRSLLDERRQGQEQLSNSIDAAVAVLDPGIEFYSGVRHGHTSIRIRGTAEAQIGDRVQKIGAGTGLTKGVIKEVQCTIFLHIEHQSYRFDDAIMINGISGRKFSGKGDSGAVVMNEEGLVYGLIFAAGDDMTVMCPIGPVLKMLECKLHRSEGDFWHY